MLYEEQSSLFEVYPRQERSINPVIGTDNNTIPQERLGIERADRENPREIESEVLKYTIKGVYILQLLIFIALSELLSFPWYFCFPLLVLCEIVEIVINIQKLRTHSDSPKENIIPSVGSIAFCSLQFLYWKTSAFPFLVSVIPLMVASTADLFIQKTPSRGFRSFSNFVLSLLRSIYILVIVTVGLKIDFGIDWNCFITLWAIWGFLAIVAAASVCSVLMLFVDLICLFCRRDNEILGSIWLFVGTSGGSMSFAYFFYSACTRSSLILPSLVCCVFVVSFILLTHVSYKSVWRCWNSLFSSHGNYDMFRIVPGQIEIISAPGQAIAAVPPRTLVKFSSTYFFPLENNIQTSRSFEIENENSVLRERSRSVDLTSEDSKEEMCKVCFNHESNGVFMPCGHSGICFNCAVFVWGDSRKCIMCRAFVYQVLEVQSDSKHTAKVISYKQ